MFRVVLPDKNCPQCEYRVEQWRDGGHCYMFKEEPMGTKCAQFRQVQTVPNSQQDEPTENA